MAYLTEQNLRSFSREALLEQRARQNIKSSPRLADLSIFLSHSHQDQLEAEGLANYLGSLGLSVYIDWKDSSMPVTTSGTTADRIKSRIRQNDFFLLMATRNACSSKWCPWELGVADGEKDRDHILILPVADPSGQFHGNEYLQIYRRAELPTSGMEKIAGVGPTKLAVFDPGRTSAGVQIDRYLR